MGLLNNIQNIRIRAPQRVGGNSGYVFPFNVVISNDYNILVFLGIGVVMDPKLCIVGVNFMSDQIT